MIKRLLSKIWNWYILGGVDEKTDDLVKRRIKFLRIFSLFGELVFFIFGYEHFISGSKVTGIIEIGLGLVLLYNTILLRILRTKVISLKIGVLTILVISLFLFVNGGIDNTGLFWVFTFPLIANYLLGRKSGTLWVITSIVLFIALATLGNFDYINIAFKLTTLRQFVVSYIILSFIVYVYVSLVERNERLIRKVNEQLYLSADKATEEIEKRKRVEKKMEKTMKRLKEKNELLEDTKTATISLLEDLEEEKKEIQLEKAKHDAMLLAVGDGLIITDKNGKILFVNPSFENMLGWEAKEAEGEKLTELVALQDEEGNDVLEEKRLGSLQLLKGKEIYEHGDTIKIKMKDYFYVRKDGSRFPVSIIISPIVFNDEVIGYVEAFRDITEERDIDKTKTEFVSLASHQLRTPLSTIGWYTEMLLDGDAGDCTDEQEEYLKEVEKANKRMIELVNSLLNVSRLELGTFSVDPVSIDIKKIANNQVKELKPEIEKKDLDFKQSYDKKIPIINADKSLVRIIFQNLLSNAVKYTPKKGKVELSVRLIKKDDMIRIKVKDTGMGIPKSQQPQVFKKLFRADNVRQKDTEGTGLGLYIVKSILDTVGGKIWFESQEGKGSTFFVEIPTSGMKERKGNKKIS